ncbi:MAG TPA: hypothetical protein VLH60_00390 [Sedimentisphaerales bacterium]|nr:hypothetical protein [Sedimentisphaerales bacterium]
MAKKSLKKGPWTKAEIALLRKIFPNTSCQAVAKRLGRPLYAAKRKAYRLGLAKSSKYMKTLGRTG